MTSIERFLEIQATVDQVHTSDPLLGYVQRLIHATRNPALFDYGISPRAGLAVVHAAKAWALMQGRLHVEPSDVQAVFAAVTEHRLTPTDQHSRPVEELIAELLAEVEIP